MKLSQITILAALMSSVITFSSCSNTPDNGKSSENKKNTYHIELVNNEKWEVNQEMMVHIENMESEIDITSKRPTPNYKKLGLKLEERIGLLTSNCTMTGKAHDELHKWLLPFIDLVKELNEADSKEKQKQSFEAIENSIMEFNIYFK